MSEHSCVPSLERQVALIWASPSCSLAVTPRIRTVSSFGPGGVGSPTPVKEGLTSWIVPAPAAPAMTSQV